MSDSGIKKLIENNNPAVLRARIATLEAENTKLKATPSSLMVEFNDKDKAKLFQEMTNKAIDLRQKLDDFEKFVGWNYGKMKELLDAREKNAERSDVTKEQASE